jgi:hypothetical protein
MMNLTTTDLYQCEIDRLSAEEYSEFLSTGIVLSGPKLDGYSIQCGFDFVPSGSNN